MGQALIFADVNAIKEYSVKLGAGEDLYALFAGILTMRPWNRVADPALDHLVIKGSDSDRSELQVSYGLRETLSLGYVGNLYLGSWFRVEFLYSILL